MLMLLDEWVSKYSFHFSQLTPFEVLISTILSARTRDIVTERCSKRLFVVANTPQKMSSLSLAELQSLISSVNFYRSKSLRIHQVSQRIVEIGDVPREYKKLLQLKGVGPKTACVLLSFLGQSERIAVDSNLFRFLKRFTGSQNLSYESAEEFFRKNTSPEMWGKTSRSMIEFSRKVCKRVPACGSCFLNSKCVFFNEVSKTKQ